MTAREVLINYALVALPNEVARARCEELADAFRAEVLREAIARLNGVSFLASERRQSGLDAAICELLDMVTGRDESAGGEVR